MYTFVISCNQVPFSSIFFYFSPFHFAVPSEVPFGALNVLFKNIVTIKQLLIVE